LKGRGGKRRKTIPPQKKRVRNALQKLSAMAVGGDLAQAAEREVDGGGTLEWLAKEPRASHGGEKQAGTKERKDEKANEVNGTCSLSSFRRVFSLSPPLRFTMSDSVSVGALAAAGAALRAASAVCLDVDSTVCTDEGIDKLAAACGVGEEVAAWFVAFSFDSRFMQPTAKEVESEGEEREKEKRDRKRERDTMMNRRAKPLQ
jgi:hypothetical protein